MKKQNENETTREDARQILKNGILKMSVERLIQMSQLGLKGNAIIFGLSYLSGYWRIEIL